MDLLSEINVQIDVIKQMMVCTYGDIQHELPLNQPIKNESLTHTVIERQVMRI